MSKVSDLIASEVAAAEAAPDRPGEPLASHVRVTRGHDRSRVLQVRLSEAEYAMLAERADEQQVPASTFARAVILQGLAS